MMAEECRRLLVIVLGTLAVLATCWSAVGGQSVSYDEDALKQYARMTQQLRNTIQKTLDSYYPKLTELTSAISDTNGLVSSEFFNAVSSIGNYKQRLAALMVNLNVIMTPMAVATTTSQYTDRTKPLFGDVVLDHSMGYDGSTGQVVISVPGVYMIDVKYQSNDYSGYTWKVVAISSDGSSRYTMSKYIDYEVSPFFEMWNLEAGDTVLFMSLSGGGSSSASRVTPGLATQFGMVYLGKNA